MSCGDHPRGPPPAAPDAAASRQLAARDRPRARRRHRRSAPSARIPSSARSDRYPPERERERAMRRTKGQGNKRRRVDGDGSRPADRGRLAGGAPVSIGRVRGRAGARGRSCTWRAGAPHAAAPCTATATATADRSICRSARRACPVPASGSSCRSLRVALNRSPPRRSVLGKGLTWPCRSRAQAGGPVWQRNRRRGRPGGRPAAEQLRQAAMRHASSRGPARGPRRAQLLPRHSRWIVSLILFLRSFRSSSPWKRRSVVLAF